ncbi:response regulator transcription factor [Chitinophagaceae bacterium LWZ2-11]
MVTIAFADDNIKHRQQIRETIEKHEDFRIVLEVANGYQLLQELMTIKTVPDIIVLDINMPKIDGLTALTYLINKFPKIRIICLSVFGSKGLISEVLTEGGMGYLTKNVLQRSLPKAVETVLHDKVYIDRFISNEQGNFKKGTTTKEIAENNFGNLTKRELEFLQLNSTELSYEEIAQLMYVSSSTVSSYYDSVAKKLSISSRSNLSLFAIKNGLVKVARLY